MPCLSLLSHDVYKRVEEKKQEIHDLLWGLWLKQEVKSMTDLEVEKFLWCYKDDIVTWKKKKIQ